MNVVRPILHFGKTRAGEPALVEGERTITYGELGRLMARTASHLAAHGIRRGDRVGLCLKDSADHVVILLAVAYIGAVVVPLDWRARQAENAQFIEALGLARVLVEPNSHWPDNRSAVPVGADWHSAVAVADFAELSDTDWQDPLAISATSGSTGAPKFTLMTHLQYYFAVTGMLELMALTGRHRFLCTLPLYYSGGRNSCITHLLRGDCVILYPSLVTPAKYVEVANLQRITVAAIVPSLVRQLLTVAGDEMLFPGLVELFCIGAPLYAEEKRSAARKLTPNISERYGTSETMAISVLRAVDFADRADSVGQPHSLAEIEIVDEDDRPLSVDSVGRLRFRGPGMGEPLLGSTAQTGFRNGWYYPGEIARLDDAGFIFLLGRTSDVIIRNGAKIYPAEIERTLAEHPLVHQAAVIGCAGADNEETVIAFVVPHETLSVGTLLAHCRMRLTPHKIPRQFRFLGELPKNTAGKVDKVALAKLLIDDDAS